MKVNLFIKQTFLLSIGLFLFLSSASAQIGIKGGIGVSDIGFKKWGQTPYLSYEVDQLEHAKPLLTYQFGGFYIFQFGERWELQPELLFITKGLNYNKEFLYDDIIYKINISYLEIPILMKYKISKRKKMETALFLGSYVAQKLRARKITEFEGVREKVKVSNVKSNDLGILSGCSLDFLKVMNIDFRISYSLINVVETLPDHVPEYGKHAKDYARNINTSLSVGYRFNKFFKKNKE